MKHPKPLPPELASDSFNIADARRDGVSPRRLRSGDLAKPFHGVRRTASAITTPEDDYLPRLADGQAFSHASAARIHRLPLPRRIADDPHVHVLVEKPARAVKARGVVGHHVAAREAVFTTVRGYPVVTPLRAWTELASSLTVTELVVAGDALLRRKAPLSDLERMRAAVEHLAGRRGTPALRRALERVRPRTDSPKETELRLAIVDAGLPEPEVNVAIAGRDGAFIGYGDLAYREFKILIEYDGDQHRSDPDQYYFDIDRLERFMRAGWRVIRVNKSHLHRLGPTIYAIYEALARAGWKPDTWLVLP